MSPFASAVSRHPASPFVIAVAKTAVQRAMTLLTGSLDTALTALPLLLLAFVAALLALVTCLTWLQPPNRLHWQFMMEIRERFLMAGRFAKSSALWSLVLACNDVPEARLTCTFACCLQILNLHCGSAFACFLLSSSLYMVMLQSWTVAVFMGLCFPIAGKKASMPTPELRRHKATGTASVRWRFESKSVLQEHKTLFQQHGMPEECARRHMLETTGMPLAEAENMLRRLKETISRDDSFLARYIACYDIMKASLMEAVGKRFPKVELVTHRTDPMLACPRWRDRSSSAADGRSGEMTHKATLQSMINEVNAKIAGMDSKTACQEAVKEFFALHKQIAKQILQREVGKGHIDFEASKRSALLHAAKEKGALLHDMVADLQITQLLEPLASSNTFTGFMNFNQCSCYMNVLLQLFCQTDFLAEYLQGQGGRDQLLKRCLKDVLHLHGRYECIAPFEVLEHVLTCLARHGVLANRQNDAVEVLELMQKELMDMPLRSEHVVYKAARHGHAGRSHDSDVKSLSDYLKESFAKEDDRLSHAPRRLLLSMPVVQSDKDVELRWIPHECSGWDEALDMSWLMSANLHAQATYYAKAAIFHIHGPTEKADTTQGHYVILVKHGNTWHMSNDASVRLITLDRTPCVPYAVYMERMDDRSLAGTLLPHASSRSYSWQEMLTTAHQDMDGDQSGTGKRPEPRPGTPVRDTRQTKKPRTSNKLE